MKDEQLAPKIEPPASAFFVAFIMCLAAFSLAHVAQYLLLSTPTYYRIGLPTWFWTRHREYTRFRVVSFIIDLFLALFCSYRAAHCYWLHRWRQRNAPEP